MRKLKKISLNKKIKFFFIIESSLITNALMPIDNSAKAASFSFFVDFEDSQTLTGNFNGQDLENDGFIDASEITKFNATYDGDIGIVNWSLSDIDSLSLNLENKIVDLSAQNLMTKENGSTILARLEVDSSANGGIGNIAIFWDSVLDAEVNDVVIARNIPEPSIVLGLFFTLGLGAKFTKNKKLLS